MSEMTFLRGVVRAMEAAAVAELEDRLLDVRMRRARGVLMGRFGSVAFDARRERRLAAAAVLFVLDRIPIATMVELCNVTGLELRRAQRAVCDLIELGVIVCEEERFAKGGRHVTYRLCGNQGALPAPSQSNSS